MSQGSDEAINLLEEYSRIKEDQGEFLAGRFLIEVYIQTQVNIEESYNAKKKATV